MTRPGKAANLFSLKITCKRLDVELRSIENVISTCQFQFPFDTGSGMGLHMTVREPAIGTSKLPGIDVRSTVFGKPSP